MADRLALKRLTPSDLTLFESLYRRLNAGNQKAINLNADVFISNLYPSLPMEAPKFNNEFPLTLSIFGPGNRPEHRLSRKIIKNPSYKNWRLNGEFIRGPENDLARYESLQPDDLALLSFDGDPIPSNLSIVLLARGDESDKLLYGALAPLLGNHSMIPISVQNITNAIHSTSVPAEHPINVLVIDPALNAAVEDAAFGGEAGIAVLRRRRAGRNISRIDLARARQNAEVIGADGEGLINAFLGQKLESRELAAVEWSSSKNAVCPYDFEICDASNIRIKLDVKSTRGPFENVLHISLAEMIEAADAAQQYNLYRVYELTEEGGKLRIARNIRLFAKDILAGLKLPLGITCDGFSVSFAKYALTWETEIYIPRPAGDEIENVK